MKSYTIPQKMSGTGSIHDIASQHESRKIKFPRGAKYAVVLASYYGGRGYTTHKTEEATIKQSKKEQEFSHQILDVNGDVYEYDPNYGLRKYQR